MKIAVHENSVSELIDSLLHFNLGDEVVECEITIRKKGRASGDNKEIWRLLGVERDIISETSRRVEILFGSEEGLNKGLL